jgi:hypothetical protein
VKTRAEPKAAKAPTAAGADDAWNAPEIRMMRGGRPAARLNRTLPRPRRRVTKKSRPPALGLTALVLFGLLAGFFGWVSAEPFWLAVGHAQHGTMTVTNCAGKGLQARCVGTFAGSSFSRDRVTVSALSRAEQRPGVKVPARMVSAKGRIAYVGRPASLHLRWIIGIALVLLCGLGVAWATGAGRLETRQARLIAYTMSLGGPLVLVAGALSVTW